MTIPDEVVAAVVAEMERHYITEQKNLGYYRTETVCACGEPWMSGDHDSDPDFDEQLYRHGALVIAPLVAEWARKEALREAIEAVEGTTLTLNDIGYENEEFADAIRALADGDRS